MQNPATIHGDLTNARDDSHESIRTTGFAWPGHDQFFAVDLRAGQRIEFVLDDHPGGHDGFDGGVCVFRSCDDIPGSALGGADIDGAGDTRDFTASARGRYYPAVDAYTAETSGPYV